MMIKDDGKGFDSNKETQGNGLKNMKKRADEMGAVLSYKMIAESCFISLDTVRSHIKSIYEKLHVHSKGEAVAKAIRSKII